MEHFPSKMAVTLAVKRIIRGTRKGTEESFQEAVKAGVSIAMNYDGARIVAAVSHKLVDCFPTEADSQDLWDKINGKS